MKALTLHQPWAQLVALGVKTIETRSWSTSYRGTLAIHAGKRRPPRFVHHNVNADLPPAIDLYGMPWEWTEHPDDFMHGGAYRWAGPLGAIVATATLVDCVPVVTEKNCASTPGNGRMITVSVDGRCVTGVSERSRRTRHRYIDKEWTEALANERPYGDFTPGRYAWLLEDVKRCDPVPARGRQGLWEWAP